MSETLIVAIAGMVFIAILVGIGGWVLISRSQPDRDSGQAHDARRVSFAAATFAGIMGVLVFAAALDAVDEGKEFVMLSTFITAFSPIAGAIVGYVIGSEKKT